MQASAVGLSQCKANRQTSGCQSAKSRPPNTTAGNQVVRQASKQEGTQQSSDTGEQASRRAGEQAEAQATKHTGSQVAEQVGRQAGGRAGGQQPGRQAPKIRWTEAWNSVRETGMPQ